VTPSCLHCSAFDLPLHDFNGKQLFVKSIGGEESSAANAYGEASSTAKAYGEESSATNAYGEESSAAHDCVKLFACADPDPDGYLSAAFVPAQAGSHLHGFFQLLIGALSSRETIGHQHPLFLHCTAMHLTALHCTATPLMHHEHGTTGISQHLITTHPLQLDYDQVSLWPSQGSGDLPVVIKSLVQAQCHATKSFMTPHLILGTLFHVPKMLASKSQKLISNTSDVVDTKVITNGGAYCTQLACHHFTQHQRFLCWW